MIKLKQIILPVVGALFIASGLWVGWYGLPAFTPPSITFQKTKESKPQDANFPSISGAYPIDSLSSYHISQGDSISFSLDSLTYHKPNQAIAHAIVYLAEPNAQQNLSDIKNIRQQLWQQASDAITQHTEQKTLFISWWDNAQRIDFFTGRTIWVSLPVADAFANSHEQALWQQLAGSFDDNQQSLKQLANWLTMDAQLALQAMATSLPKDTPVYLLVCLDDLARVSEIEKLSGKKLGFEARFFAQSNDMHSQISAVKSWASETGTGSYLVQTIPGQGIRAWRISDSQTENSLLAKLLPFTSSLANPIDKLETVYQSNWGSYLTIYHLAL